MKQKSILAFLLIALTLSGCNSWFSYSAYEARVPAEKQNTTSLNLRQLEASDAASNGTFGFAVLSDPHYHYDALVEAVTSINADTSIKFVVVTGDLTDQGLLQEFLTFHDAMQKLNKPYLTVIGNHDYLSNGEEVYRQMFGALNYTFAFNGFKFVVWDNTFWESNRDPDFEWLEYELRRGQQQSTIVLSHIPPFGDQFTDATELRYRESVTANVTMSVHGHNHVYYEGDYYNDGTHYLVLPWMKERRYCKVAVGDEHGVQTKMVSY